MVDAANVGQHIKWFSPFLILFEIMFLENLFSEIIIPDILELFFIPKDDAK